MIEITRRVCLKALGGVGLLSGVTGVTAAQNDSTESDGDGVGIEVEQETETTYLAQITQDVRLIDYEITEVESADALITADLELSSPQVIVTSDILGGVASSGVSQVQQSRRTLPSGRAAVEMQVGTFEENAAVGIAAPGGAITISTGLPSSGSENTLTLPEGIAYGGGTALAGTGLAAWRKSRDDLDAPEEADLDG